MKTGFDIVHGHDGLDTHQLDFLRKTVSIMSVLSEEALKTSERFAKACGREVVTADDMHHALMYETHEFFEKDIERRFLTRLQEERQHTYETDDEGEEGEREGDDEDEREGDDEDEREGDDEDEREGDDEDERESEENEESEKNKESFTNDCCVPSERSFHAKVLRYADEWNQWTPEDPVHILMKNAIDKTRANSIQTTRG
jgi:histone H3/H4